jgi:hypothetical protein
MAWSKSMLLPSAMAHFAHSQCVCSHRDQCNMVNLQVSALNLLQVAEQHDQAHQAAPNKRQDGKHILPAEVCQGCLPGAAIFIAPGTTMNATCKGACTHTSFTTKGQSTHHPSSDPCDQHVMMNQPYSRPSRCRAQHQHNSTCSAVYTFTHWYLHPTDPCHYCCRPCHASNHNGRANPQATAHQDGSGSWAASNPAGCTLQTAQHPRARSSLATSSTGSLATTMAASQLHRTSSSGSTLHTSQHRPQASRTSLLTSTAR